LFKVNWKNKFMQIKSIKSLFPIFKQAIHWNSCFNQTIDWINEREKDLSGWDKRAKQSLAVGVCNGAVYEPKLK